MTERQVFPDASALAGAVAEAFLERIAAAQAAGEVPQVALTGGTIAEAIHEEIARRAPSSDVDWTRVAFWWGDERFVAPDSSDRNARGARDAFLDKVGATQVHEMPSTATAADVSEGAATYGGELRADGSGDFDLVMLGLGPDGHVASLFPGFPQLDVDDSMAVGVTRSPKPPPERITLTYAALNRTRAVWFLVSGEEKAGAVARATAASGDLHDTPARGIAPHPHSPDAPSPEVVWFLDTAAASRL